MSNAHPNKPIFILFPHHKITARDAPSYKRFPYNGVCSSTDMVYENDVVPIFCEKKNEKEMYVLICFYVHYYPR